MRNIYKITQNSDSFLIHGRTIFEDDMLALSWTDSGLEFNFCGNDVIFSFGELIAEQPVYVAITVDGKTAKYPISTGKERILIENLEDKEHHINLLRLNADGASTLFVNEIIIDGESAILLAPPIEKNHKIEYYGDSITCGYGDIGLPTTPVFLSHEEDGMKTFAYLTSLNLNAEGRYVACSGQGIKHSWSGEIGCPFEIFTRRKNANFADEWDFSLWAPDVVVINAGTNDSHGGTTLDDFYSGAKKLLNNVRNDYKDAVIIWLYGMMGNPFQEPLKKAINELSQKDKNFYYLPVDPCWIDPEEAGANGHPGYKAHIRVSEILTSKIKDIMGW